MLLDSGSGSISIPVRLDTLALLEFMLGASECGRKIPEVWNPVTFVTLIGALKAQNNFLTECTSIPSHWQIAVI